MLADLGGVPMVVRVAERARLSQAQSITIATDDERIEVAAKAHGFAAIMTDADHPTGTDRLAQAATLLGLAPNDIVVNVQGDEPLIDPNVIDTVAHSLQTDSEADIATCASPLAAMVSASNPNVVKVVCNARGHALYFSRAAIPYARNSQGGAPVLHHIGLYAYRVSFLQAFPELTHGLLEASESLEQLRALEHGFKIKVNLIDQPNAGGVDTPEDLLKVQQTFKPQH
jgi:3-deoxy-manno-octulosonate cytidylyltransferase (CMP-KDO synthetase)